MNQSWNTPKRFILFTWMLFLPFLVASCVSIPQEAPELSAELGKRISAIQSSHINLLHKFMDEKRDQVDEFLMEEWVPLFAKEVFSEDIIKNTWMEVCTSGSEYDRLRFITMLGPKIQRKINNKRVELMKPLDDLELTIERTLRNEYAQAAAINNSITSFLASAAEVAEARDRYLNMLGIGQEKISNALDEADQAVSEMVKMTRGRVEDFNIFKERIEKVITDLKRPDAADSGGQTDAD
jgi:hypothetical protein